MANKPKSEHPDVVAVNEIYKTAREQADIEIAELKEKQARIAEAHEVAGRVQAFTFVEKVVTVSTLMQLARIKESKVYRDLPNIGTWENYCDYLKLDRHTVDERLRQLETLGAEFLETCHQFSISYRDLRKLRQLTHAGAIQITDDALEISGERIPLDADHKEDLQAAIENIIAEQANVKEELKAQKKAFDRVQDDTRKSMTKLQKDLDRLTAKAEARGYTADEAAFIDRMEAHRLSCLGAMAAMEPAEIAALGLELTPRMRAKVIAAAHEIKMNALALYDTLVAEVGSRIMNPELIEDYEKWLKEYHKGDEEGGG